MTLYFETKSGTPSSEGLSTLFTFKNGKSFHIDTTTLSFRLLLNEDQSVYLFGDIFYHIKGTGRIKLIDAKSSSYLKKVFTEQSLRDVISSLEGQYVGILVDSRKKTVQIFSDRYARLDTFYAFERGSLVFSNELDRVFSRVKPRYDQKMLGNIFSTYGWYTPKGRTIYKNVNQLNVGEILTLSGSGLKSRTIGFKPLNIEEYSDRDLETYYQILRESVVARANRNGRTWISSSSGWDSSMLLGMAVQEFGAQNVDMVTGSLKYSDETDIINKFEINKIKKIGKFYGIKPNIVELDFKNKNAADYWAKLLPFYRSRHMYTYTTFNFTKLSDKVTRVADQGQTILNGETSDSFHNFGFSQFVSFFHTEKSFTEYADKMNCYLYGPSFLKKVLDGTYNKDKVFNIFKKMLSGVTFDSGQKNRKDIIESYLVPLFYGSPRLPFARTYDNPALLDSSVRKGYRFPFREYMPEALSGVTEKNIYSWIIYMYHHFHSQGSTVNIQKHSMEYNQHRWRSPFNDYRMIELLSKAPEKWGRGLDFNNTKYPLKWVAQNKIKFPYELLDEGPHSYLYDVIEGFSLFAEITYRSGVTDFMKESLRSRPYREILSDDFFDIKYLDRLTEDFLDGREASGQDFNNLVSLITLCVTGWYR